MPSLYDTIVAINADQIQNGLSPLVQLGKNNAQIAAIELQRQRELQDQAQKNLFTQQLLDRQHQFQSLRDQAQHREQLGYLREQSRLIAERQAADDERAYRKQIEAEAFRYGVETKGKTPEQITKEVDQKVAANVKADLEKRQSIADQIIKLTQQSSLASKQRVTQLALSDPNLLKAMTPETIQKLREGKTQISDVIANLGKRTLWNQLPFTNSRVADATAAYNAYAVALKQATEQDKTLNPDFPLAVKLSNLNNDLQILDKNISDQFGRIRNVDLAKGIFSTPAIPTIPAPAAAANPIGSTIANPMGGFPLSVPTAVNPLQGLGLPPTRPISNVQPLPPPVSSVGDVIPAPGAGLPYSQEYPPYAP